MTSGESVPELITSNHGYYTFEKKPSEEELKDYYATAYYQQGKGSYNIAYTEDEIKHFKLKAEVMFLCTQHVRNNKNCFRMLDIGCGEGWVLEVFKSKGCSVYGIDFSVFGVNKFNPQVHSKVKQGNIYHIIKEYIELKYTWDVIIISNVIEHVAEPENLLESLKQLLALDGTLVVTAPNDFSVLHRKLLEEKIIDQPFWVVYPDHLNYFNKLTMEKLLTAKGFLIKKEVADNPVDLNILNSSSNYIKNRSLGKSIHNFRVCTDLFLAEQGIEKFIKYSEALAELGVGRDLTYYCTLQ